MSSVSDYRECERCGGVLYSEFNCNTFNSWEICTHCGYSKTITCNKGEEEVIEHNSKGAFSIMSSSGAGTIGCLPEDMSDEAINELVSSAEQGEDIDIKRSYIVLFNAETKAFKLLFGTMPKLFEEEFKAR